MSTITGPDGLGARPDSRDIVGPFDIIGDVHGCAGELEELLARLGYHVCYSGERPNGTVHVRATQDRRAVFVGDLVDRGPRSPDVLRIVMAMVEAGLAHAVPGNHDVKLVRWLEGRQVKVSHGLDRTVAQLEGENADFRAKVLGFIAGLPSHLWLDGGRLAVAHAGIKDGMLGRVSGDVRSFCLYGETSGETDEFGLPIRYHWAAEYKGSTAIVYGHTPVPDALWINNTMCVDTGCCFGGRLSALRWPEREIVSVEAAQVYCEPVRPFGHPPLRPGAAI
jgi:protein phosphatase